MGNWNDRMAPCPFCGEADEHEKLKSSDAHGIAPDNSTCVECQNCGAHGPWASTEEGAAELWNSRERSLDGLTRLSIIAKDRVMEDRKGKFCRFADVEQLLSNA